MNYTDKINSKNLEALNQIDHLTAEIEHLKVWDGIDKIQKSRADYESSSYDDIILALDENQELMEFVSNYE